jgi:hypothetical protein
MADCSPRRQFWTKRHDRALEDMVRQQWMSPPTHPLRVLKHIAKVSYAYECGRIFYPTPEGRAREKFGRELRQSPQAELNLDPAREPERKAA